MRLQCLFHLNLAFSSLEEAARPDVVRRCYWPMLRLPERTGFPIAFEATGWTLDRIGELDPAWLDEARRLIDAGLLELVASGRAQCAAPLLPWDANAWNLRLGLADYARLLGQRPRVALVSEQAYAPGLVQLYADAGFEAIVADWENAARSHPHWPRALRRLPQWAAGTGGAALPVIWSESLVFQRFQRMAHGQLDVGRWVEWIGALAGETEGPGLITLYTNDAEVFDHRPGRFAAEPPPGRGEWDRIAEGLRALAEGPYVPVLPSAALELVAGNDPVPLESAPYPVPVKKQEKYNIARWAVTGRDDLDINTRCARLHRRLRDDAVTDAARWRDVCDLWASDLRTHITDARWAAARARFAEVEAREHPPQPAPAPVGLDRQDPAVPVARDGALVGFRAGPAELWLNPTRGLAIHAFADERCGATPLFGTIEHGYYDAIELGADWYSATLVQETPGHHKVADLNPVTPAWEARPDGGVRVWGEVPTAHGQVEKSITLTPDGVVEVDLVLRWPVLPAGSLRFTAVTLHPKAFDAASLFYAAHNGGQQEDVHALGDDIVEHGRAISGLVSSSQGLGLTEGVARIGDASRHLVVEVDRTVAAPLGLVTYRPVRDSFFLRLILALAEHDDTRRGAIPRDPADPQRLRLRIRATAT